MDSTLEDLEGHFALFDIAFSFSFRGFQIDFYIPFPHDSDWIEEIENFNWKACAAKYLYRTVTMEDYLIEYIHTQVSFREISGELLETMVTRLKEFAETKPQNMIEMMPPR